MSVRLTFDSEECNYIVRTLVCGLSLTPGPAGVWNSSALLMLAGACLCLCSRRTPTTSREDLRAAAGWCGEAAELKIAGVYDRYLEPRHSADVRVEDGSMKVVILKGRKPWDAEGN